MSINLVNNNLSLSKIAGNSNLNRNMRNELYGKVDILYSSSFKGSITLNFTRSLNDYDYIEIEFSNDTWLLNNSARYHKSCLSSSSSSNQLRMYIDGYGNFSFYKNGSSSLVFTNGNMTIKRIIGFKVNISSIHINNKQQGEDYSYNTILTDGVWINNEGIFRKVIDYKLANSLSSFINVYHYLCPDKLINLKAFAIKPNGETYILPYCDENGNITSINLQSSGENFCVMIKGITWEAGTIFRFIVDYTK